MNYKPQQGKRISLTSCAVLQAARDGLSVNARSLVAAVASKCESSGVISTKMSRKDAGELAGLSRRAFVAAVEELFNQPWIEVQTEKRKASTFTFRVESFCADLGTPYDPRLDDLGTVYDPRSYSASTKRDLGTLDDPRSQNDLGTPDVPRWINDMESRLSKMIQDQIPILVRQMYQDGQTLKHDLGTPDDPRINNLGTPDDPRTNPSCARATAAATNLINNEGSRRARELSDRELIREVTVAKVTAENLDCWILESCQKFGRNIGAGAAQGLSMELLRSIGDAELVREYVFQRLVEHEAGDKRAGDRGFTSFLMRDAKRWIAEHHQRQAKQTPKQWGTSGFVQIQDDTDEDETLVFDNPFTKETNE